MHSIATSSVSMYLDDLPNMEPNRKYNISVEPVNIEVEYHCHSVTVALSKSRKVTIEKLNKSLSGLKTSSEGLHLLQKCHLT